MILGNFIYLGTGGGEDGWGRVDTEGDATVVWGKMEMFAGVYNQRARMVDDGGCTWLSQVSCLSSWWVLVVVVVVEPRVFK